uniref:Tetratricopeptide repeat domain 7A n=1 Tax=Neolamprologus brichardi TaxID=32507 RepID=A0A3Q4HT06_NEOBR
MAEALLEECLLENMDLLLRSKPLVDKTQPKLCKAKRHLNTILSRGCLTPRYLNEALLLMAKVHYVQGRYRDAQGMCARVGLEELTQDDQPTYHLRLLAEAFVIKGLSLDHQTLSAVSRVRLSEREEESLSCYLRACDAALSYLQELDKVGFLCPCESMSVKTKSLTSTPNRPLLSAHSTCTKFHNLNMFVYLFFSSQCLERAMKFSFNEFHLWHQLGLSLMAARKVSSFLPPRLEALSQSVVSMGEEAGEFLPKAYLALGLCCSLQASDDLTVYGTFYSGSVRVVSAAMEPLQAALSLCGDDLHSLHLLTLLLSAQKHHRHALDTLTLALGQHPDNFNLLFTKVKLEEVLLGPAAALHTCEEMLQHWQSRYDVSQVSPSGRKPSIHLTLPDFQDASTGSQSPSSVALSRLEAALSEVSDLSSTRRHGPTYIWTILERIWLQAGMRASVCVRETKGVAPGSRLDTNPPPLHSFIGRLLVKTGRVHLGEKVLRDAVQIHSTSHEAWSGLGEALQSRDCNQAPDCFLTALELEASSPVRPFTVIPREL